MSQFQVIYRLDCYINSDQVGNKCYRSILYICNLRYPAVMMVLQLQILVYLVSVAGMPTSEGVE
jgi:hypothetical protein